MADDKLPIRVEKSFCVATMDTLGYIGSEQPELAIDRHFAYWLGSKKNQSSIVSDVPSFDYLVKTYQGKLDEMCSGAKIALENYFNELFQNVTVEVTPVSLSDNFGMYRLEIALQIIYKGQVYDLLRSIEYSGKTYKLVKEGEVLYERV